MKVILSSNPYRDYNLGAALEAKEVLEKFGVETVLVLPFDLKKSDDIKVPSDVVLSTLQAELPTSDVLICFGGDGTILHAARDAVIHNIPILGINMGSVGFMAELERTELFMLRALAEGRYTTENRMMIQVRHLKGERVLYDGVALNDAVISKGSMARVAEVEVIAGDIQVTTITGDGVIVSTPTGSTAYSMSSGGAIVEPTTECLLITPICAHQLTARPMVLSGDRVLTLRLPKGSRKHLYLAVDGGKTIRINPGERIEIYQSQSVTRLIRLTNRSFFHTLNQKLRGNSR
ncbi:MAG: NAD(+)/NADH kinase [Eubacteriales bacterium]